MFSDMTTIQIQSNRIIVLNGGEKAKNKLRGLLPSDIDLECVEEVRVDRSLGTNEIKISPNGDGASATDGVSYLVGSGLGKKLVGELLKDEEIRPLPEDAPDKSNEPSIIESTGRFVHFSEYETQVQDSIKNVSAVLSRAFGRRTGMSSWALKWFVFERRGFTQDNYKEIQEVIESPEFIKKYAGYLQLKSKDEVKAAEFLAAEFDKREKGLVEVVQFTTNTIEKVSTPFAKYFPIVFSIQDVVMPWLARLFKNNPLGKLCDFIRIINPWVGEFVSEPCSIFNIEHAKHKDNYSNIVDRQFNSEPVIVDPSKLSPEELVSSVKLVDFDKDEYRLYQIMQNVNAAVGRLFGRKNNIASWALHGLFMYDGKYKSYDEFANKIVNNPEFIKKLCAYFKEIKELKKLNPNLTSADERTLLNKKFASADERIAARVASGLIMASNSLNQDLIEKGTRRFGIFYSFQSLFLPLAMKLFVDEEKEVGKLLGVYRDFIPLINNFLVDPIATFKEEIINIRKSSNDIKDILPEAPQIQIATPDVIKKAWSRVVSFAGAIADFFRTNQGIETKTA